MKITKLPESFDITKIDSTTLNEQLLLEREVSKEEERAKAKLDKRDKKIKDKANKILAKDFGKECSKATFYVDNNYDKGMDQSQWRKWIDTTRPNEIAAIRKEYGDEAGDEEEQIFVAQINNAIVVNAEQFYIRRGTEWLVHSGERFVPGRNDTIRSGYYIEPYEKGGVKNTKKKKKTTAPKSGASRAKKAGVTEATFKAFVDLTRFLGVTIFDDQGKKVSPDKLTFDNIANYRIKSAKAILPVNEWIIAVKTNKLMK